MRRADLLRAGGAAAVIHFGLVNVRQKALVAVFIWRRRHGSWSKHWVVVFVSLFIIKIIKKPQNSPVKSSKELVFSRTTSFSPLTSPPVDLVR